LATILMWIQSSVCVVICRRTC